MSDDLPDDIKAARASTRDVYGALRTIGPCTQKDLCRITGRGRRSIYNALEQLLALELVHKRIRMPDTRMNWYWLHDQPEPPVAIGAEASLEHA